MINNGHICKINDAMWICIIFFFFNVWFVLARQCIPWMCHHDISYLGSSCLFRTSRQFLFFLIGWQGRCLKLALMFSARAPLLCKLREKSPYLLPIIPAKQHLTNAGTEDYPVTAGKIPFVLPRYGFLIWFGKCNV